VDRAMAAIEHAAGHALAPRAPGEAPKRVMRHTLDPLHYKHRPLLVYLATHCLVNEVMGYILLRCMLGFRRRRALHITYWHRPATAAASSSSSAAAVQQQQQQQQQQQHPPLVFVHGIGLGACASKSFQGPSSSPYVLMLTTFVIRNRSAQPQPPPPHTHALTTGLVMYWHLLTRLPAHKGDIFLVELPHASLKICEFVPSAPQAVASLRRMLADHGHERAVFAAHSLGTVYVSWMCRCVYACVL
jgi:hypothetical protein